MRTFNVEILQIRASSFHIGLRMGRLIQNRPIIRMYESISAPSIDIPNMRSVFSALAPHLLEELEGLAQGLDISTIKAATLFSGYEVPKTEAMGCSSILTKEFYMRNYDFSPNLYDGIFSLIQPEKGYASAGYNLQLIGRHDGVNQEGLVIGLHFVSNTGYTKGLSPWTSIRMVLDSCTSVEDAVIMLKEIPHAACYNFSIGDRQGNQAIVEASPEKVIVRRGDSILTCVNHFQADSLKSKNRRNIKGSVERNNQLLLLEGKNLTQDEMFHYFKDKNSPIFLLDYDNLLGTLHTFSYSYQNSRLLTTIAHSNEILDMNFQNWVNGKDINISKLNGWY